MFAVFAICLFKPISTFHLFILSGHSVKRIGMKGSFSAAFMVIISVYSCFIKHEEKAEDSLRLTYTFPNPVQAF